MSYRFILVRKYSISLQTNKTIENKKEEISQIFIHFLRNNPNNNLREFPEYLSSTPFDLMT